MTTEARNGNGRLHLSLRELAALAAGVLIIDDARIYGLIDGGLDIDRAKCEQVLREAKAHGIVPDADEAAAKALELMAELGAIRQ